MICIFKMSVKMFYRTRKYPGTVFHLGRSRHVSDGREYNELYWSVCEATRPASTWRVSANNALSTAISNTMESISTALFCVGVHRVVSQYQHPISHLVEQGQLIPHHLLSQALLGHSQADSTSKQTIKQVSFEMCWSTKYLENYSYVLHNWLF